MKHFQHLRLETDSDDVLWLTLDVADDDCNTLHTDVLQELSHACMLSRTQQPSALVLRSAKPNFFAVGLSATQLADISTSAQALEYSQLGQSVCQQFADLPFPTIALLDGKCTDSGLELAVALNYRIASSQTQLGFAAIQLGLHPYFGGVYRTIDKIGLYRAMAFMLSGEVISPPTAKHIGLIHHIVPSSEFHTQILYYIHHYSSVSPNFSLPRLLSRFSTFRKLASFQLRCQYHKQNRYPTQHYPAPSALFRVWEQHGDGAESMYDAEADSFAQLLFTDSTRNLIRVQQLQARLQTYGSTHHHLPIQHIHIIGRHQTGQTLADWCRQQGLTVTLQTVGNTTDAVIQQADVIIDAINDNLAAKQQVCAQVEQIAKPNSLLTSITTTALVEDIAAQMRQPHRLIGLNCSKIVTNSPLVEVIFDPHVTDQQALKQACQFITHIQKLPLPVKSSPGFLINRLLLAYLYEGIRLHQQGIPATVIDQAARDFGLQWGPLELADSLGLPFCQQIGEVLEKKLRIELPLTFYHMIRNGRTGKAAGYGFYKYRNDKIFTTHHEAWHGNHTMLQERLVQQVIHSAQTCLAEGVVENQDFLDAGMIFGMGFARFRGGLLHYAQTRSRT